ncbi:class I SAM-dependent DNA methyltransferase [Paenibacillus sp. MMS18-CY102]|uniref:class I SAM-dependent DNA methyltransferase n=1 Tax=Paenibacillus sp. MMS18-CY102 TaxID=2682849 RepID=UPI0013664778|nr:class I SAM-dependent methyltransferase [Paenibacillus sp. MMS18-CY102]MWC27546.1 methyltransferase domain-containing protein [Paenibacillus sp. MMS18-CY102]
MAAYRQFASVYDRLMEHMPYADWLRFARTIWEQQDLMPRSVVDLGCGTGNLSIPLAKSGFDVFAIDLSADMLSIGRGKWDESPRRAVRPDSGSIRWLQQDMREWELPEPVDTIISFCDCLNYLTEPADVEAAFRSSFQGLREGGKFLFDVLPGNQFRRYAAEQPFTLDERDVAYIWTCEYDESIQEIEHSLTIFARDGSDKDGRFVRIEETHVERAYDDQWLVHALGRAGFARVERYADFDAQPLAGEAPKSAERLFYVATK